MKIGGRKLKKIIMVIVLMMTSIVFADETGEDKIETNVIHLINRNGVYSIVNQEETNNMIEELNNVFSNGAFDRFNNNTRNLSVKSNMTKAYLIYEFFGDLNEYKNDTGNLNDYLISESFVVNEFPQFNETNDLSSIIHIVDTGKDTLYKISTIGDRKAPQLYCDDHKLISMIDKKGYKDVKKYNHIRFNGLHINVIVFKSCGKEYGLLLYERFETLNLKDKTIYPLEEITNQVQIAYAQSGKDNLVIKKYMGLWLVLFVVSILIFLFLIKKTSRQR